MGLKAVYISCCLIFMASCGNGGGSSPVSPSLTADFVALTSSPASGSVTLQKNRVVGDVVYVDVKITNLSHVFGADIRLDYDKSKVHWTGSYEPGNFLEKGGTPQYWISSTGDEFTVVLFGGQGTEVGGSGVLLTIPFKVTASVDVAISFNLASRMTDSTAPNPATIAVSSWNGGTVKGM